MLKKLWQQFMDLWNEVPVDVRPRVVEPEVAEPEAMIYCGECGNVDPSEVIGIEYAYGEPNRYDGVSEWKCLICGSRTGRWSKKILGENESEPPFGGLH